MSFDFLKVIQKRIKHCHLHNFSLVSNKKIPSIKVLDNEGPGAEPLGTQTRTMPRVT